MCNTFLICLIEIITWRFWKFNRLPTSRFTYEGQLDGDGTPSGAGKWMDTVHGGEILTGHWRAGRPVAPYQSQEQRPNGGAFSANSLAFLNLGSLHRVGFSTEFRGPQFGRAGVECRQQVVQGQVQVCAPVLFTLYRTNFQMDADVTGTEVVWTPSRIPGTSTPTN